MGFARSSRVPQYFHADKMIKRRKFGSALLVSDKILIDFLIDFFVLTQRLQHNIAKRCLISHFILLLPLLREIEQPIHLRLNVRAKDTNTARTRSFCVLELCRRYISASMSSQPIHSSENLADTAGESSGDEVQCEGRIFL